ncbi:transcobalamin-1-like isoform X2 [Sphaerodactylus townsendi]|uniref:transcobalamin-1-like isoform X2 n=1 Tax=Sphaerodactylus townsendi TaxID=933632 RepID=UPI0020267074|nr:transcobalamin-1-like isoform X2 [Sphaerodactylus townsendi]
MRKVLGFLFLLLIQRQCCFGCAVSEEQRPQVTSLLNKMIQSATAPEALPNPSVLLALQLAQNHSNSTKHILLQRIAQDAVDRFQNESTGNPLSNYYQLGLCVLTLCQLQGSFSVSKAADLFTPDQKKYYLGGHFSVDTASLAVLAQICIQTSDNSTLPETNIITANIQWLLNNTLEQKRSDGVIGNMYSTGEAMQALSVASDYITPGSWNCSETLDKVVSEIPKGTFDNPMAAAQLLPALMGQTYLDVSTVNCSIEKDDLILTVLPAISSNTHHQSSNLIKVKYMVTDSVSNTFTDSTTVSVPKGSVLLRVMEAAQENDPKRFRFTYANRTWGPYITSVRGLMADNSKRTYWQLLSGETPLSKGAGEYVVSDEENMVVKFTTY